MFTLDPAENNNKTKLSLTLADHPVKFEKTPTFLGLKLDCQLTFAAHAEYVKKRMAKRRNGLAAIARRSVGTSQHNLRAAYIATTRAVADYSSAVWMNHAQPSTRKAVEAAQNKCARVITGCLGLTNEKALLACTDLPPLRHVAQERASVLRERLLRIPDDVPAHKTAKAWVQPRLKSRTYESWKRNNAYEPDDTDTHRTHGGCWRRIATEMDCIAEMDSFPPTLLGHCTNRVPSSALTWQTDTKKEKCDSQVSTTNDLLDSLTKDDIEIWTDGSVQEGNQNGGGAAAIITTKLTSTTLKSAAGAVASYEAEMEAIKIALEYVSTLGQEQGTSVRIMTDSLSSLSKLATGPEGQDANCGITIWKAVEKIGRCTFVWVPAHCGLEGNECADVAAGEATHLAQDIRPLTLNTAKAVIKKERRLKDKRYLQNWATTMKNRPKKFLNVAYP